MNRDADLSVIVCAAQPSTASVSSVSLEEFEVHLPALTVAPHATGCGAAWPISQVNQVALLNLHAHLRLTWCRSFGEPVLRRA